MGKRSPSATLTVRTSKPATPARVAEMTTAMAELVAVTTHGRAGESLTLVVDNLNGRMTLRGWEADGAESINRLMLVAADPIARIQGSPEDREVALALAAFATKLGKLEPSMFAGPKRIARLDDVFVRATRAAGTVEPGATDTLSGETSILSVVLRVGRTSPGDPLRARLSIEGATIDVQVEGPEGKFWDAAKHGREVPVTLFAVWRRDRGELHIDRGSLRATGIEPDWEALSGRELLDAVRDLPKPTLAEAVRADEEAGLE